MENFSISPCYWFSFKEDKKLQLIDVRKTFEHHKNNVMTSNHDFDDFLWFFFAYEKFTSENPSRKLIPKKKKFIDTHPRMWRLSTLNVYFNHKKLPVDSH